MCPLARRRSAFGIGLLALLLTFTPLPLCAQSGIETGTITDETGARLPGATVTVVNLATNQARFVVTNEQGLYRFFGLTPSKYSLTAELPGFATLVRPEFTVNVGAALDISLTLKVSAFKETVIVQAEAPIVEGSKTALSTVVTREQIQLLPTNSRNYLDFALLTPGAVENVSTQNQGSGLNIGGARAKESALLVDGFYNMDEGFALPRQRYSLEAIQEFQVVSLGGTAEFGRAIGGIVNAVTMSGGNSFSGTAFGFFRDKALNSRTPQERQRSAGKAEFDRRQFGASLGGPIVRDRTFFFGSVERQAENTPFDNSITKENAAALGLPPEDAGTLPSFYRLVFSMGKVDHSLSANNRLQGTWVFSRWTEYNKFVAFQTRSRNIRLHGLDIAYQFKWTGVARQGKWLHEIKAAYFPRDYGVNGFQIGGPPLAPDGQINQEPLGPTSPPRVNITNVARFGSVTLNNSLLTDPVQVIYSSTAFVRNHSLKVGTDIMLARFDHSSYTATVGVYTFGSLAQFRRGEYSTYTQSFGDPRLVLNHHYASAYVQDSWAAHNRLTLNYGLRYDLEIQPKYQSYSFGKDHKNVGPRLALSYDLTGKGVTFLKVSSGIYYDRLFLNLVTSPALFYNLKQAPQRFAATWRYGQAGAPVYPNTFADVPPNPPTGIRDLWIVPDKLEIPTSGQVVATVDHAFGPDLAVSASLLYNRSWNKEMVYDRNLTFDATTNRWVRPDATIRSLSQYSFTGRAEYVGLVVEARKRLRDRFSLNASATIARAYDTGDNYTSQPVDLRFPENEWGPSIDTPRVRVVASGSYEINRFAQVSASYRGRSGDAFDARAGASYDLNGDGNFNDRTAGFTRNSFRGPATHSLDARLMWTVPLEGKRLQFVLEGFNVLNRSNVGTVSSTYGPTLGTPLPLFLTPLTYFSPRELQLGVRFAF